MFKPSRNLIVVLFGLALPSIVSAGLSDADRARLADQIDSAALNLDPSRFPRLDDSKANVLRQTERTRNFFRRATSESNNQAWMEYLNLQPLITSIESDESVDQIGREALAMQDRLVGTAPGLELTVLRNLRHSVDRLIASIRFRDSEEALDTLSRQLESLAQRVRQLDDPPSSEDAAAISAMIDILSSSGQAADVVRSLRGTFSRPNVAILISERMIQRAIDQNVNQDRPVNDCILGTRVIGTANLNGTVTTTLLPSVGTARIQIALVGTIASNNIGYNRSVRLRTSGYGNVNASRTMTVNDSGVSFDPVIVDAQLQTRINAIEHHLRIVRNIARKQAAKQKPLADRIANGKLRPNLVSNLRPKPASGHRSKLPTSWTMFVRC